MNDPTLGLHQDASTLALAIGITLCFLIFVLPRRHALIPVVLAACYLPVAGKFVIADLNFSMLRLVALVGLLRLVLRHESRYFRLLRIDSIFFIWMSWRVIAFTLLWGTSAALVNGLGYAADAFGLYILFRTLIQNMADFKRLIAMFALALVPVAILMCLEKFGGRDPFYVMGGVPQIPEIREGVIRCQGPFGHPILAGTFGAVWLPLFIGLWVQGKGYRATAFFGMVAATIITVMSGSSGPIGSYAAGIFGFAMWKLRNQMRLVRWAIVAGVIALHLIMKDPVWFIFARVDVLSGSTGWHRANLIDQTIKNFSDWWLFGAQNVQRWGVFAGDTTNQFIAEGVRGGLFTMLAFIWIVVVGFSFVGLIMKASSDQPTPARLLTWSIGTALFANVVSFFGVSYYDQNIVNWYLVLAAVAASYRQTVLTEPAIESAEISFDTDREQVIAQC